LQNRQQDDILLLAGKGHEDYQVLKDETIYFDEKVIVETMLSQRQ
jgi:UDP-N-acetylmuramoyl-L-alanyl-D-glutamate--2,6-diaminopimelate ligase